MREHQEDEMQHAACCPNCGQTSRPVDGCWAGSRRCAICGTRGHVASMCRGGPKRRRRRRRSPGRWNPTAPGKGEAALVEARHRQDRLARAGREERREDYVFCLTRCEGGGQGHEQGREWRPEWTLQIAGSAIPVLVDMGATVNIMGEKQWRQLRPRPKLKRTETRIFAYGAESPLAIRGAVRLETRWKQRDIMVLFYVVIGRLDTVVGCVTAVYLRIVMLDEPRLRSAPPSGLGGRPKEARETILVERSHRREPGPGRRTRPRGLAVSVEITKSSGQESGKTQPPSETAERRPWARRMPPRECSGMERMLEDAQSEQDPSMCEARVVACETGPDSGHKVKRRSPASVEQSVWASGWRDMCRAEFLQKERRVSPNGSPGGRGDRRHKSARSLGTASPRQRSVRGQARQTTREGGGDELSKRHGGERAGGILGDVRAQEGPPEQSEIESGQGNGVKKRTRRQNEIGVCHSKGLRRQTQKQGEEKYQNNSVRKETRERGEGGG